MLVTSWLPCPLATFVRRSRPQGPHSGLPGKLTLEGTSWGIADLTCQSPLLHPAPRPLEYSAGSQLLIAPTAGRLDLQVSPEACPDPCAHCRPAFQAFPHVLTFLSTECHTVCAVLRGTHQVHGDLEPYTRASKET